MANRGGRLRRHLVERQGFRQFGRRVGDRFGARHVGCLDVKIIGASGDDHRGSFLRAASGQRTKKTVPAQRSVEKAEQATPRVLERIDCSTRSWVPRTLPRAGAVVFVLFFQCPGFENLVSGRGDPLLSSAI